MINKQQEFETAIEQARIWASIGKANQAALWIVEAKMYGAIDHDLLTEIQDLIDDANANGGI